jgi:hypothetical protein
VRAGLSLEELSKERAQFIAGAGWGSQAEVQEEFESRDAAFRRAGEHDEIVLWFEHDLYDQLQLIQVLDGLAGPRAASVSRRASLICEPEYLGTMAPQRAAELFSLRNPVTRRHLHEASAAWKAFCSPDPRGLESLTTTSLPFLEDALRRQLEEFPWTTDGLSRTERQVINALRGGPLEFSRLIAAVIEEQAFLGDAVLAWHLARLSHEGLVEQDRGAWAATGKPRRQRLPRWLGGYEVKDESLRWDPASGRLVP